MLIGVIYILIRNLYQEITVSRIRYVYRMNNRLKNLFLLVTSTTLKTIDCSSCIMVSVVIKMSNALLGALSRRRTKEFYTQQQTTVSTPTTQRKNERAATNIVNRVYCPAIFKISHSHTFVNELDVTFVQCTLKHWQLTEVSWCPFTHARQIFYYKKFILYFSETLESP